MSDPSGKIGTDPIELVMKTVAGQVGISPHVLRQTVSVESFMETELQHLMLRVVGRMYSREIPMSPTYRCPLNWWEAVRKRWCPAWWLRRFPVREEVFVFTGFHDYPGLTIGLVEPRLRIEVLRYTTEDMPPEDDRAREAHHRANTGLGRAVPGAGVPRYLRAGGGRCGGALHDR